MSSRIFLLIAILIIQIINVDSQTPSVNLIPRNDPSPTDSQPISLTTHVIKVGYMGTGYSRNNFTASVGNVLFWIWEGKTPHSVAESTLETPCEKKNGGFDFGVHSEPFNATAVAEDRTYVFFSYVGDDCKNGMYGGINLPADYVWPKELTLPPEQIYTTPLNPITTPTGSVSIQAESAENTQESSTTSTTKSSSASYDFKRPGYGIIIGALTLLIIYI